jgi:hypothetical protein
MKYLEKEGGGKESLHQGRIQPKIYTTELGKIFKNMLSIPFEETKPTLSSTFLNHRSFFMEFAFH